MAMIKAIVFDLDGTLVDSSKDIANALNYVLTNKGLGNINLDETLTCVGNGLKNAIKQAIAIKNGQFEEEDFDSLLSYYNTNYAVDTYVYAGVQELLKQLQQDNILLGILSNKADLLVKKIVSKLFKDINFSYVSGKKEDSVLKPNEKVFTNLYKEMNINKNELLYIGDSEVDIKTLINTKVDGIIVTYGFRNKNELNCDYTLVDNTKELLDVIRRKRSNY